MPIITTRAGKVAVTFWSSTSYPTGTLIVSDISEAWDRHPEKEGESIKVQDASPFIIDGEDIGMNVIIGPDDEIIHFYTDASPKVKRETILVVIFEAVNKVRADSSFAKRVILQNHFYAYKAYCDAVEAERRAAKTKEKALETLDNYRIQALDAGLSADVEWEENEQNRVRGRFNSNN